MMRSKSFERAVAVLALAVATALGGCAIDGLLPSAGQATMLPGNLSRIAPDDDAIAGREFVPTPGAMAYTPALANPQQAAQAASPFGFFGKTAPDITPQGKENLYDVVTVMWGTDRKIDVTRLEPPKPQEVDGQMVTSAVEPMQPAASFPKPGAERGSRLTTGSAIVTIPKTARVQGAIPRPRQYTFLNVTYYREQEDPARHFTISSLGVLDQKPFAEGADKLLERSVRFKDQAFVFVHGYNTSFESALYRTAQIAYDLEFDGLAAMYSWPSRGTYVDYSYDLNSAERAQFYFVEFLRRLATDTRVRRIHVIAHSMGNRPLLEVLRSLQQGGDHLVQAKLGQIVFAAPDVDRDLFADITAKLQIGAGKTLYASNEDKALILSKQADGVPRAGDVPKEGPLVLRGVDTIDISDASTKALLGSNHSDYAERSHILKDIQLLFDKGVRPPDARFPVYRIAETKTGRYWKYAPNR